MAHISNAGHSGIPTHYDAEPAAPAQQHAEPAARGKEPGRLAKKSIDVIGNGVSSLKRRAIGAMEYYNSVQGSPADESDVHASHARLHGRLQNLEHEMHQLLASFAGYADGDAAPHGSGRADLRLEPEATTRPASPAARQDARHHANFQRMAQSPAGHDSDTVSIMSDDGRDDDDLDSEDGRHRGGRVPPLIPDRQAAPGSTPHEARQRDDIVNRAAGIFSETLAGNLKVFAEMNRSSINDTLHLIK